MIDVVVLGLFEKMTEIAKPNARLASLMKALGSRINGFGSAAQSGGATDQLRVMEVFEAIHLIRRKISEVGELPAIPPQMSSSTEVPQTLQFHINGI